MAEPYIEMPEDLGEEEAGMEQGLPSVLEYNDVDNVVDLIDDEEVLIRLGHRVVDEYQIDLDSMEEWLHKNEEGMKLAVQEFDTKSFPWPGAANIKLPMIATAAEKFATEAYGEIVKGKEVVKTEMYGATTDDKTARAKRVSQHMNFQVFHEMEDWEEDLDALLNILPIIGCVHRKTYYDHVEGKNVSRLCLDNVVINQGAESPEKAPRITEEFELTRNEITERERMGLWRKVMYSDSEDADFPDDDGVQEFLEQHRWADLDDDGYEEPYVVTVHKSSRQVVRITARYTDDDVLFDQGQNVIKINPYCHYTKFGFAPALDGTYWSVGWGHKMGPIVEAANTLINQLVDAGTISNAQGGFISQAVRMKKGDLSFRPGEWKPVQVSGGILKDSIMPVPVREPSNVLFLLLGFLSDQAREISAVSEVMMGEQPKANMAATSVLALIEQGKKTFSGIYKRIWRSLKREFKKLHRLNATYTDPQFYQQLFDEPVDPRADYNAADYDVIPTANPEFSSKVQRMALGQAMMEIQDRPGVDQVAVSRFYIQALEVPNPDQFVPPQPNMTPQQIMEMMEVEKQKILDMAEVQQAQAKAAAAEVESEIAALELMVKAQTIPFDTERAKANMQTAEAKVEGAKVDVMKKVVETENASRQDRQDGS